MIITIDGPAGAGKSTAAKMLAQRLGFEFLDTGAMFRAITLAALRAQLNLHDQSALAQLLTTLQLEMPADKVLLDGENVTGLIRTAEITAASAPIADSRVARQYLVTHQRQIAAGRDMVCEGRDQGTIVFPDSPCKFFLRADPRERARRRQAEMAARGDTVNLDEVLQAQQQRDERDAKRDLAPMKPADDAIELDSTAMTIEQVVDVMEQHARSHR